MNQTVRFARQLAYALFFVFLCTAPLFAFGQDSTRLIDIPDILNNSEGSQEIRDAVSEYGHTVFNNDDIEYVARKNGMQPDYWMDPALIPKMNKKARHDAFVIISHESGKKNASLVITIYNANTSEVVAEMERVLKKKKVTKDDVKAVARGINSVVGDIPPFVYPPDITITITSNPTGATVMRDGSVMGTTPYNYVIDPDPTLIEQWTLTYPGRDPVMQSIAFDKSNTYDVKFLPAPNSGTSAGKVPGSTGRPVFLIGFNISPTIHDYNFTDNAPRLRLNMSHKTKAYAVFSFDVAFFPFGLFTDIDYLQGLGLQTSVGFGFLDTNISTQDATAVSKCTRESNNILKCGTSYIRFNIDLIYRLLLQKKDGRLNPDGMALDFMFGFNLINYTLDENPYYLGNDYKGVHLGTAFSTPLGLPKLRLKTDLGFYINAGHDDLKKFAKLGTARDYSWGLNIGLKFMYDIWKGIYVQAGYDFKYIDTKYKGVGTVKLSSNAKVENPKDASIKDMYHEIMLGFGYMFY